MFRTANCPDQRETALVNLIREKTAGMVAAVRAGQPQATKLLIELLGDYLTSEQAVATLIRESLAGQNSLQRVITDLIFTEVEQLAERERQQRAPTMTERIDRYLDSIAA